MSLSRSSSIFAPEKGGHAATAPDQARRTLPAPLLGSLVELQRDEALAAPLALDVQHN